jgi:hypothetical protein
MADIVICVIQYFASFITTGCHLGDFEMRFCGAASLFEVSITHRHLRCLPILEGLSEILGSLNARTRLFRQLREYYNNMLPTLGATRTIAS